MNATVAFLRWQKKWIEPLPPLGGLTSLPLQEKRLLL
jgi:hypothetical protein